jgi:hypothetical protein
MEIRSINVFQSAETMTGILPREKPINEALKNVHNLIHIRKIRGCVGRLGEQ